MASDTEITAQVASFRAALGWLARDMTATHPRQRAIDFLKQGIELRYKKATEFAAAVQEVLFEPEFAEDLAHDDRQRCLISVLATRAETVPLAIHTYLGLMEGIAVAELRNIFFLVGVYTGVPGMVNGIDILNEVLRIFASEWTGVAADAATAHGAILDRLKAQFSVGAFGLQLVQSVAKDLPDDKFNLLFGTIRERAQRTGIWFGDGGDPV